MEFCFLVFLEKSVEKIQVALQLGKSNSTVHEEFFFFRKLCRLLDNM
jgi:hypothetical protein